ncbi:MAG: hypothetical protein H7141_01955 [Burkholderiales bacterium]|nr:hypothetical protein [Bacteroidia bacterium]
MDSGYEATNFQECKILRMDEPFAQKTEPVQTSVIDEIQKEAPFVFIKTEEEPIAQLKEIVTAIANEVRQEEKPAFKIY